MFSYSATQFFTVLRQDFYIFPFKTVKIVLLPFPKITFFENLCCPKIPSLVLSFCQEGKVSQQRMRSVFQLEKKSSLFILKQ